jgi:hypothetical protein
MAWFWLALSPVMSAPDDLASYFYVQTFAVDRPGHLALLPPEGSG